MFLTVKTFYEVHNVNIAESEVQQLPIVGRWQQVIYTAETRTMFSHYVRRS